jgi:hypothetical protein
VQLSRKLSTGKLAHPVCERYGGADVGLDCTAVPAQPLWQENSHLQEVGVDDVELFALCVLARQLSRTFRPAFDVSAL